MSGDLFSVYGKIQYSPLEQCPDELRGETIKVKSKDGDVTELEAEAACMSRCIKTMVLANGVEEEIEFPLKKATVAKVCEYMKYHREFPFGSIKTPLESDNLVECGATKWDSTFVAVDKDQVIDLALAASIFQIPSLFFLTGAKLAVMTKDKPADKLLKDFALALDLDEEEEGLVKQKVDEAAQKRWGNGYEDSMTAMACIVSALTVAAEKNGLSTAGGVKSYRLNSWRTAVFQNWKLLEEAPSETRSDKDLVMSLMASSSGAAFKFASDELRSERDVVLEAVKYNGALMFDASDELKGDRDFLLQAVKVSGAALQGASEELRGSREFVLEAARRGCGSAMQGAADFLRADRELVMEATMEDPEAFKYASEELRNDKTFVLEVVMRCGRALQHVPLQFKADKDVAEAAVYADDLAAAYAHASRRAEMGRSMPWDSGVWQKAELDKQEKEGLKGGRSDVLCPWRPDISPGDEGFTRKVRVQKFLLFSGMGTITPNIGQVNYLAANSLHDRMPAFSRPEVDTVTLLQGAVGGTVGMRWKAFASADQLAAASPESMLQITDECAILRVLGTLMDPPEAVAGAFIDELSRQYMLAPSAGVIQGPPAELAAVPKPPAREAKPTAPRPEPARAEEPKKAPQPTAASSPLGGWPGLVGPAGAPAWAAKPEPQLEEGARVQVVALSAGNKMNGKVGTVLKQYRDGKWKVKMDDNQGNVLVTSDRLQVVVDTPSAEDAPEDDEPPPLENGESDDEPPPLENGESDHEPPPLENAEESDDEPPPLENGDDVEEAMLLASATAPISAPFAAPPF